ncbi:MAG: Rnase Y domain-containing protein, partial [Candidatus Gottesmanbacteria bacterium]|nr:Rnase Y domain-containing protein [Candidatus Gottesmanbacteria bacterium]
MFDVLKTLSGLVKNKKAGGISHATPQIKQQPQPLKPTPIQPKAAVISVDNEVVVKIAEAKARELIVEAKDEVFKIRRDAEEESRRKLIDLERKEGALEDRDLRLKNLELQSDKKVADVEKLKQEHIDKLEKVAHLTRDEARAVIMDAMRDQLKENLAREVRESADRAKEEADAKAKDILVDAMRHGATDYVAEYTVSVIKLTDEDMKGRIIGKEGRNIRAFETATGVDVDLDEEGVIRLSCFDPVRREIARVTLERLLRDGRVQPGRIEEIVEQVQKEIERIMFEEGQKLCHAVGVYNLPA